MPAGQEAHASATALARSHGQWGGAERATDDAGHAKAGHAKAAPAGPATPTSAPAGSLAPATPAGNAHSGTDDDKDAQDAPSSSAPVGATDHVARPATPAVIHTDAVQRATPSTRPEPATPPHQQIVSVVEPLRRRGDGSYQVTLRLNPEDLGPVDLHVQLHHDAIELHMHTDHDHARAMLNEHLGDLRHELTEAGFRPTTVDVSDGRSRQQSPTFSTPQTPTGPSTGVSTASQPVAPVTVGATSQSTDNLDVRI
jgi:flagellar hook-length control protein FliK